MSDRDSIEELRRLVGEDPRFQRRVWAAQRAGWVAMATLVLLALAGGMGDGPLSAAQAVSPDGALRIRHDAVTRQDSATQWHIALPEGERDLSIRSPDLSWIIVRQVQPAPEWEQRGPGALALRFAAPGLVSLEVQPDRPGLARVEVTAGGSAAAFRVLVLP